MKYAGSVIGAIILLLIARTSQAQLLSRSGRARDRVASVCQQEDRNALSEAQKQTLLAIQRRSEHQAKPGTLKMVRITRQIYDNMLSSKPDNKLRRRLSKEMDSAVLELLHIKGDSIRESIGALTEEQRQLLRREVARPGAPGDLIEVIARTFHLQEK